MTVPFPESIARYEDWLRRQLGGALVEKDLRHKHKLMRRDAPAFLRGSCWRWAETAATIWPALADGPAAPSVGDAHVANFGLWRDSESRLVWGVNDYDEAAELPYRIDLARLLASALLASGSKGDAADYADAVLDGYAAGLREPRPWVLEEDHGWLRKAFTPTEKERARLWSRLEHADALTGGEADLLAVLGRALPPVCPAPTFSRRRAGVGSLGRPRIVALSHDAGGPVAREAKALVPSCWAPTAAPGAGFRFSHGPFRAPDPFLRVDGAAIVRRLAPDSRKVELSHGKRRLHARLLAAMAREIGSIHAGGAAAFDILRHLERSDRRWLESAAATMIDATLADWEVFKTARKLMIYPRKCRAPAKAGAPEGLLAAKAPAFRSTIV